MKLIFDIEGDNFLEKLTKIHCIVAQDYDTGKIFEFTPKNIKEGLKLLKDADVLIGHNIMAYDIPAIKKLYPRWTTDAELFDTLLVAKLGYPDRKELDFVIWRSIINKEPRKRTDLELQCMRNIGKHSLESYGLRLGEHKGDFGKTQSFEAFTPEMLEYCKQDVIVNTKLYHKLLSLELGDDIIKVEHEAHRICLEQTQHGFQFDIDKAKEFESKLLAEMEKLQDEIKSKLGGSFIIPLEVKVPTKTVRYKDPLRGSVTAGCPYTKLKVKEFNPTSRHDLSTRLIERFGWKPREFGSDGKPTLSEEILNKEKEPIFKTIADVFTIQKRLGMLAEGKNAWLNLYNEDTHAIHGQVDTLGTGTHRCTHKRPNLGQIPSVRAPYGKECRELFTVPKGWKLFGTDAAGLELRMLAHYMTPFDNGEYADTILNGDIHTKNQESAGLPTRNDAKTFIYAFLYGAGDDKIGSIIGGTKKQGKEIKNKFFRATPAMRDLTEKVKYAAKMRGYVKSLDGRRIPVRSEHSALNFLLQSSGAVVCKYWMVEMHKIMAENGFTHGVDYKQSAFCHDELQWAFDPSKITEDQLRKVSKEAMTRVGDKLKVRIPLDVGCDFGYTYADTH